MPSADVDVKPSWADQVEEGEGEYEKEIVFPSIHEEYIGNKKIVTEYKVNDEGKKVKIVRYYNIERRQVPKCVARRKMWKKFGAAATDPPGPNPANTIVGEEIFMNFLTNKEEEQQDDNPLSRLKNQKWVVCRYCKQDHWTANCPFKDKLSLLPDMGQEDNAASKPSANAPADEKAKSGKYVPPSLRDGGNKRGESMGNSRGREEHATIRITNLPEEIRDSDLHELFKPFGSISRVYLAVDKATGVSKGFAFVSFHRKEDACRAIAGVNGFGYANLILNVEWAKPSGANQ